VSLLPLPDLPPVLVSPEGAAALETVTGRFVSPAGILIECPLGDAAASADLSLSFSRPANGGGASIMSGGWPAGTEWERVRRFVDVWRDPAGPLWNDVQSLWLEFDLRRREAAPLPNVFFGHRAGLRSRATMHAGLDLLLDRDAASALALAPDGLGALPPAANVLFVGAMLARRPPAIRFCVDGPPWQDAPVDLIRMARHVVVQVEAGASAASRVGYELYHSHHQRGRAGTWRPLLDRLVEIGAARADRCAAALEWTGYVYDGSTEPRVIDRWINHVKLTCEAGSVVEAKVYLQFASAWKPAASDAGGPVG
jgi:hypothetical protein